MSCQGKGTTRWAAPELFRFDESLITPSTRSDVYSLGSTMLQVCAISSTSLFHFVNYEQILTGDIPYHYIHREEQVVLAVGTRLQHKRPAQTAVTDDRWHFIEWCWIPIDGAKPRPSSDEIVRFTGKDLAENNASTV